MRSPLMKLGAFALTGALASAGIAVAATAATAAPTTASSSPGTGLVINEIESNGGTPGDWIEFTNLDSTVFDMSGMIIKDNVDSDSFVVPTGTTIQPGGFVTFDQLGGTGVTSGFDFGLGASDSVRLYQADGTTLVDSYTWTSHATTTYGRQADGTWATTLASTKNAANSFAAATATPSATPTPTATATAPAGGGTGTGTGTGSGTGTAAGLAWNEVESNGDDTDWAEVTNTSNAPIDISGFTFKDSDDSHAYVLPSGSIVEPGKFFVIDQTTTTHPAGFDFGLGAEDAVRLFDTTGALVISYSWTTHSTVTYGRCPDGTGNFTTTTVSTKGAANDCTSPIRINEVESNGGTPDDWVELTNISATTVDISGYVFKDSDDSHSYVIPTGTTVGAGGFTVLDTKTASTPDGFDFGLGSADSVRLYLADGTTLVDSYSWTKHAGVTYGRNPDGTGDFDETSKATKGSANVFEGTVLATPWPGSPDETALDAESTYTGDLSGLDYEPDATDPSKDGTIWGVENGNGKLYKIVSDGTGGWAPSTSAGWTNGKTLKYADGTGTPDAEGVTVADNSSAGGVYVSTERNNDVSSVSRPAILKYDVSSSATTLTPSQDWNLAADFPGLGANSGAEGVTWIPDSFLTGKGFIDQNTGAAYKPASYSGHGDGLFFVGIEGTASVYAYALMDDGSFTRIATIATSFPIVADVQFDADLGQLWVICDDACSGQTALFSLTDGAFTQTTLYDRPANAAADLANEGFAIAPAATSVDGQRLTFYADDNDTDGFSFRVGSYPGEATSTDPGAGTGGGTGSPGGSGLLSSDELTSANRGSVADLGTATPGATLTISVGVSHAGEKVKVYLYSTPKLIATGTVSAAGTVPAVIPADTSLGAHKVAVYAADGTLLGWSPLTVAAVAAVAVTDPALAFTGTDIAGTVAIGLALLAAGAAALVVRRRRAAAAAAAAAPRA